MKHFAKIGFMLIMSFYVNQSHSQKLIDQREYQFKLQFESDCNTLTLFNEKLQRIDLAAYKINSRSTIVISKDKPAILLEPEDKNKSLYIACCLSSSEYNRVQILVPAKICINIKGPTNNDTIQNHKSFALSENNCFDGYLSVYAHITCYSGCPQYSGCYATYVFQNILFRSVPVGRPTQHPDRQYENGLTCGCCPGTTCGIEQ